MLALLAGFFAYQVHVSERQRRADQAESERRLLAEQRQAALDKALLVAMSGDLVEGQELVTGTESGAAR